MVSTALFALALAASPDAAADRMHLTRALEQLVQTGEPRHVDHDDGADLQAALTSALADPSDIDQRWLATRAAIPIVPRIARPIGAVQDLGALEVRAKRVLTLPWTVSYDADIEGAVDGGAWLVLRRVRSDTEDASNLGSILSKRSVAPGFHSLQLRARIHYAALPSGLPREETRPLPTVFYGVWDPHRPSAAGAVVRRFVERGLAVPASALQLGLPGTPILTWLVQLARPEPGMDAYWHTEWCARHAHSSDELSTSSELCTVIMMQTRGFTNVEVWVKIGELQPDVEGGPWIAAEPSLAGAYLRRSGRAPVSLAMMPLLIDAPEDAWPMPIIVVRAADVDVTPSAPLPGEAARVRATIDNIGSAPAYGVTIEAIAASDESSAAVRRLFVRDIPAGERVDVAFTARLPLPYGFVMVHAMMLSDHADWPVLPDPGVGKPLAIRIVNPAAAPPGFGAWVCNRAVGRADCADR